MVKLLMTENTDVDHIDSRGLTILDAALIGNNQKCIAFLIRCGANADHLDLELLSPECQKTVLESQGKLVSLQKSFSDFIVETLLKQKVNTDLCQSIISFVPMYSISKTFPVKKPKFRKFHIENRNSETPSNSIAESFPP